MAYGNAIGSINCNASLIAAITISVSPGKVNPKSFSLPTAFFLVDGEMDPAANVQDMAAMRKYLQSKL